MPLSNHLSVLLDTDDLAADWHHRYGVTSERAAKLCGSGEDSNSFLNPKSETALTLLMLGKLDDWFQSKFQQPVLSRNDVGWNKQFFRAITGNTEGWPRRSGHDKPFVNWVSEVSRCERDAALDTVLLFEFEARNSVLANSDQLCPVSFLDIAQSWCQFDALVILPTHQHLVFVESKLASDMSRDTSRFPFVSQAIRGWESAFLMTRCEESMFHEWNFTNLLLCPRKPFEYRTAYYSHVFADPADHVARYRSILENEYTQRLHRGRFNNWFDEFQTNIKDAVKVVHWDELAQQIGQRDDWSSSYLSQLRSNCGPEAESAYDASRCRFRLAGICFDDDSG